MSDDWFAQKLEPYGKGNPEDGCHPAEAQALKDYLRHQASASEAARAITLPIEQSEDPDNDLPRLYGFIMDALIELPEENLDSLVELVKSIEQLPEPDFDAVDESKRPTHGRLWRGLPGFGHLYSDCDSYRYGEWPKKYQSAESDEQRDRLRNEYVRRAAVEARLVMASDSLPIDWGYETVTHALERVDCVVELELPAAAQWLITAGRRFYEGAKKEEESYALENKGGLWTGGRVMTLARWLLWRQRLEELTGSSQIASIAGKGAAESAVERMKALGPAE